MNSIPWSSILQCPETGLPLERKEDEFMTATGWPRYPVIDGIPRVRNMVRLAGCALEGVMGIVFDFDDTLVESESIKQKGFRVVAERHGIAPEQMQQIQKEEAGRSRYEIFRSLVETFGLEGVDSEELVGEYAAYCEELIGQAPEIEGALEFLKEVSRRTPCFICSATPRDPLHRTVTQRGWGDFFEKIYGYPDRKSEVILEVANRLKTEPKRILMAGDLERDWQAAREAGSRFLGVGERLMQSGHLHGFPVILNWKELGASLRENGKRV